MNKKKKGKKINGWRGWFRFIVMSIVMYSAMGMFIYLGYYLLYNSLNYNFLTFLALIYIIVSLTYFYYLKQNDKYHIRPINEEEYKSIQGKNLIHYTDFFNTDQFNKYKKTGSIELIGNASARANYRMRYKDKTKKFVWFHLEGSLKEGEPEFNSFIENHITEGIKREYKIIIKVENFSRENLFINPVNKNILVLGDVLTKGRVETDFYWYNDKIYFKKLFSSVKDLLFIIPVGYHQFLGSLINFWNKLINAFFK